MSFTLPQAGQSFEGRYVVEKHIGSGGFAEVYRAVDSAGQQVAIKLLVPSQQEWAATDKLMTRFEREGELLGKLTNEHTVKMIEMGRTGENLPFIVFEFIDGTDLAEVVDVYGSLPPKRVITIIKQVCSALQEAHGLGVMHRDIKPANIMIYQHLGIQGLVKLLDFGIAKPTHEDDGTSSGKSLTTAGMVLGTPRYMAPEQFTGSAAHPASDIYSLGLVAYELLVGESAIDAESNSGIFRQQLSRDEFKIPKSANVPPALRRVIEKMVQKDRDKRYQDVTEVLIDLEAIEAIQNAPPAFDWIRYAAIGAVAMLLFVGAWRLIGPGNDEPVPEPPKPTLAELEAMQNASDGTTNAQRPVPVKPKTVRNVATPTTNGRVNPTPPTPADLKPKTELPPPPPDYIQMLKLDSIDEAKSIASKAYTGGDWDRAIAACRPYAVGQPYCTRIVAESYKNKNNVRHACYWFDVLGDDTHELECP